MDPSLSELGQAWQFLRRARFAEAEKLAASVLRRFPGNVSALAAHAAALWGGGGSADIALGELRQAVALEPDNGAIRHNLATLLASNGDLAGSNAEFRNALRLKPNDTQAFFGLVSNIDYSVHDELLKAMVAMHGVRSVSGIDYELLCFALAKAYDDLGEPARAMDYAIEANGLVSRPFDLEVERRSLDDLRRMAVADAFRRLPVGDPSSNPPLLIVGMNRSGTTLVESILSRHPAVLAQGEVGDWPQLEGRLLNRMRAAGRPAGRNTVLTALNRDWMNQRAGELRALIEGRSTGSHSIAIDKLPDNALRLGLVSRIFPNAKIVHVRRHPLDVGLSNYFRRFTTGQGFAFRMDWIGAKVRLVADSMACWKTALDLPILDVSYERLVTDPEGESRRLVEFAGLEWDEACLSPSKTQRSVLTASQWQVRQPIYTGSVGRWRRYEPWLAPMIEAMGGMDWIEKEMADQASRASLSANRS